MSNENLNIMEFNFPQVSGVDLVFPTFNTIPKLLDEAKRRGFYNGNTKYNILFHKIFHEGGKIIFKKDLPDKFKNNCYKYFKVLIGSFAPKYEEKEAVCSLLLSELVDIDKYKNL